MWLHVRQTHTCWKFKIYPAVCYFYTSVIFLTKTCFSIIGCVCSSHWSPLLTRASVVQVKGHLPWWWPSPCCTDLRQEMLLRRSHVTNSADSVLNQALTPGAEWKEHKQISTAGGREETQRDEGADLTGRDTGAHKRGEHGLNYEGQCGKCLWERQRENKPARNSP